MRPVLLFDMNGTLLDVDSIAPVFRKIFGSPEAAKEWFGSVVLYSQSLTLMGGYEEFTAIAEQALMMFAASRNRNLTPGEKHSVLSAISSLPLYPEVSAALGQLHSAGFRLAMLTNSTAEVARLQVTSTRIEALFEHVLSVEQTRKFKPAPETYQYAGRVLGAAPGEMMMVAGHAWDVLGAMRAGLRGAFISRPGKAWFGMGPEPEISGADLSEIATRLLSAG